MKKILIVVGLVFCVGCASRTIPLRNQIHTGMTLTDVWQLYGYDTNDPNTYNNVKYEFIDEHTADECIINTYRFLLCNGNPKSIWARERRLNSYLLTFRMCQLPNHSAVQEELQSMTDNVLVRITLDESLIRHSQGQGNLSRINQMQQDWQHWELKNQLLQIENQASFDRLQMRRGGQP